MKLRCLTLFALLAGFGVAANGAPPFLRVTNKYGDYWVYRFSGLAINVQFDVDYKSQQVTDRQINLLDIDIPASFVATLSGLVFRPEGANLAKIRLLCKQAGCVISHYDSKKYNELDIVCESEGDCVNFVQAAVPSN
jgi:hypothetical protein